MNEQVRNAKIKYKTKEPNSKDRNAPEEILLTMHPIVSKELERATYVCTWHGLGLDALDCASLIMPSAFTDQSFHHQPLELVRKITCRYISRGGGLI